MVASLQGTRIRNFFGLFLIFLGSFAAIFAISLGISGLVMYYGQGDLFWLGNPGAGPRVTSFLIIEGFILELGVALSTVFFGYSIKGNLQPSLELLKKAKEKLVGRGKEEFQEEQDLEEPQEEKQSSWPRLNKFRKDFEAKAPKCLWISLLLLCGVNLGLSLTCRVLAGGDGSLGVGQAMRNYGTDPNARRALDWAQQTGECCGDQVYTDWLNVQWCTQKPNLVPSEVGPPGYVNVCRPKHRNVKNDVPGSCCTPPRSPCIHDPLDLLGLGPLHNDGCAQFIKEHLDPKYITIAKFHLFLCMYKLLLVGLVLLLRPKDDPQSETATDEEAKNLLDDEETKGAGLSNLRAKASAKSWFSGLGKKADSPPKASGEKIALEEGNPSTLKQDESKKLISSAVKFVEPIKRLSKIAKEEEGKASRGPTTEKAVSKGKQTVGSQASSTIQMNAVEGKPGSLDLSSPSRSAMPMSGEINERGIEMRSSRVSRTRSHGMGQVTPRMSIKGSLSEWSRPSPGTKHDVYGSDAAQITPSLHEQKRVSAIGVVD